jgi:hypothetical protein
MFAVGRVRPISTRASRRPPATDGAQGRRKLTVNWTITILPKSGDNRWILAYNVECATGHATTGCPVGRDRKGGFYRCGAKTLSVERYEQIQFIRTSPTTGGYDSIRRTTEGIQCSGERRLFEQVQSRCGEVSRACRRDSGCGEDRKVGGGPDPRRRVCAVCRQTRCRYRGLAGDNGCPTLFRLRFPSASVRG